MAQIVMVVDDDPIVRLLHRKLVKVANISQEPLLFTNGRTAIDFLYTNYTRENDFIILLDKDMPVMDGWEFLEEITSNFPAENLSIAMVSAFSDKADVNRASAYSQVVGYHEKPLQQDALKLIGAFAAEKRKVPLV
ncbi:MAG TPA: response regulator [Sphingobacteriaceae bacterium]